jgi:hypothetical protein
MILHYSLFHLLWSLGENQSDECYYATGCGVWYRSAAVACFLARYSWLMPQRAKLTIFAKWPQKSGKGWASSWPLSHHSLFPWLNSKTWQHCIALKCSRHYVTPLPSNNWGRWLKDTIQPCIMISCCISMWRNLQQAGAHSFKPTITAMQYFLVSTFSCFNCLKFLDQNWNEN